MIARVLKYEDEKIVLSFMSDALKNYKNIFDQDTIQKKFNSLSSYLKDHPLIQVVGTFEKGQLIAIASMFQWPTLPYWTLGNLYSFSKNPFEFKKNGIAECVELLHEEALKRNLIRFYYAVRLGKRALIRLDSDLGPYQRIIPAFDQYTFTLESIVPANSTTTHETYNRIMGFQTMPYPQYLGSATLKEKFLVKTDFIQQVIAKI